MKMGTAKAVRGKFTGTFNKPDFFPFQVNILQPVFIEIAQPVSIQHIKVTGVHAAVCLCHILNSADSPVFTGFRKIACGNGYIIFEGADVRLAAV